MTSRTRIIFGASLIALATSVACSSRNTEAKYLQWYGVTLGQISPTPRARPEVSVDDLFGETVEHPGSPWTVANLTYNQTSGRLVRLEFRDEGTEVMVCDVAPCGPGARLKSVAQIRADGAAIKADLEARLGPPSASDSYATTWLFPAAADSCGSSGKLKVRITPDPTHKLFSVTLQRSDDDILLQIIGADLPDSTPGVPPPPSPPNPNCGPH